MSSWKGRFFVVTVLLVICCALIGFTVSTLNDIKSRLDEAEEQLANTDFELASIEKQLHEKDESINVLQVKLIGTEAQLDSTTDKLNTAETQLADVEKQLTTTSNQLKSSQSRNSQMLSQYASLKEQISTRFGLTTEDIQSFITPDNSLVSSIVQKITDGYSDDVNEYWRDCEKLYGWVNRNIMYSCDSYVPILPDTLSGELRWFKEYWRMPEETLQEETGDCEDMALLLASMLLNYNENRYPVWLLTISSADPEGTSHMAVAFPVVDDNLTIVDPAGNYYTGYPSGSLRPDTVSVAIDDWLSHWDRKIPNAEVVHAFSLDFDERFSSTDEFITWSIE